MEIDPGLAAIIVAAISLVATALSLLLNSQLEHRLTKLEESKAHKEDLAELAKIVQENAYLNFTQQDRDCLKEIKLKMEFLWKFYQGEAARNLRNPPMFSAVFDRIQSRESTVFEEYEKMDPEERFTFINYLEEKANDGEKSLSARLMLGMLNIEREAEAC
jgi:uncharacterized coiled-coil protein SlyX